MGKDYIWQVRAGLDDEFAVPTPPKEDGYKPVAGPLGEWYPCAMASGDVERTPANTTYRRCLGRVADGPSPEALAEFFHDTYERLAPEHGYRTREASAKPWSEVPERNRALMIATCAVVLAALQPQTPHAGDTPATPWRAPGYVGDPVRPGEVAGAHVPG